MSNDKKKKKTKIILGLTSGIVIVGSGVGVGTYFLTKKYNQAPDITSADLIYVEDGDGYKVTGVNNTDPSKIKTITVPTKHNNRLVKNIDKGAFKGCSSVVNISLPFIGQSNDASYGPNALFGWIFGDEMFSGGGAYTWQNYLNSENKLEYAKYVIPYSVQNITITGNNYIAPGAFSNCRYVESITFNESKATEIGNYAFNYCSCLYDFTMPNTITKIEDKAFENCSTLQNINIPNGVTKIGKAAFSGCTSAIKSIIPASVTDMGSEAFHLVNNGLILIKADKDKCAWPNDWVDVNANVVYGYNDEGFYYKDNCHVALCGEGENKYLYLVQWIGDWARATIDIPDTLNINGSDYPLKIIGANTFSGNVNVNKINIGKNVESIGTSCFEGCTQLHTVNFSDNVKTIGKAAFKNCTALKYHSINFESTEGVAFNNVETIQDEAFMNCTGITKLDFSKGKIKKIGDSAFENNIRLKGLFIPKSLETFGKRTFFGSFKIDDSVTTTTYPLVQFEKNNNNIKEIPEYCFASCGNRSTSAIYPRVVRLDFLLGNPSEITKVCDYAFNDCYMRYYQEAVCPKMSVIGDYAFYNSKMAIEGATMKIAPSTTKIGKYAFRYCNNFPAITFIDGGSEPLEIGDYAFADCANVEFTELVFPDRLVKLGDSSFRNCSNLQKIALPKNPDFTEIPNYCFSGCTYLRHSGNLDTGLSLPNTITKIGSYAFNACSNLEKVTCDSGMKLTSIGGSAFSGCTLLKETNLDFSHLESMGTYIFNNCSKLVNPPVYTKGEQTATLTTLPSYTYANNTSLVGDETSGIVIDSNITTIGTNCFYGCSSLKKITFNQSSLTSISSAAFQNCSSLKFGDAPLKPISVGELAFSGCTSLDNIDLTGCRSIGTKAFENCKNISTITLKNVDINKNTYNSMGASPFLGWDDTQTIHFNKTNINGYTEGASELTTHWGWKLKKDSVGDFYTCDASGSSTVHFVDDKTGI